MKFSKRSVSTIVLCLIFLFIVAQPAFAADSMKLKASTAEGIAGKTIEVSISVTGAEDSFGGQFDLSFDEDVLEPDKAVKGAFLTEATNSDLGVNLELEDGKLRIIWATPDGSDLDEGVVCVITFDMLEDGESALTFSGVVASPEDIEVAATHTAGKVTVIDAETAKENAIKAAEDAIDDLPALDDLTLADKPDVEAARELVEKAKDDHGAVDADFDNLDVLVAAEARIAKLEAIKAADDAIIALPSKDSLTLDDKAAVVAARALVNAAKEDHGAVDSDFQYLARLIDAEDRIKELEGLKPTPPTGGTNYLIYAGALIMVAGLVVFASRKRLFNAA